jgi:hypothetical protein
MLTLLGLKPTALSFNVFYRSVILAYLNTLQCGGNALGWLYLKIVCNKVNFTHCLVACAMFLKLAACQRAKYLFK